MKRLVAWVAGLLLTLALASPAKAQYRWGSRYYYNPWTGGTVYGGISNPWTGGYYYGGYGYNPWIGGYYGGQRFYNPYWGVGGYSRGYYNPWNGLWGYRYGVW